MASTRRPATSNPGRAPRPSTREVLPGSSRGPRTPAASAGETPIPWSRTVTIASALVVATDTVTVEFAAEHQIAFASSFSRMIRSFDGSAHTTTRTSHPKTSIVRRVSPANSEHVAATRSVSSTSRTSTSDPSRSG